jgi:hypothetical protein
LINRMPWQEIEVSLAQRWGVSSKLWAKKFLRAAGPHRGGGCHYLADHRVNRCHLKGSNGDALHGVRARKLEWAVLQASVS